jgi:predicted MPP superfamily phosphohydrolase
MPMGFRIREVALPILPKGKDELRILHFSDIHLTPYQRSSLRFIRSWSSLHPDLVISTGDHISSSRSIPLLIEALGELLHRPGFFVFGSNDYFAPRLKNPFQYLMQDDGTRIHGRELPWRDLEEALSKGGWMNLTGLKSQGSIRGVSLELRGTDDAHLGKDDYALVAGPRANVDLSIGVTHAPYKRIIDAMSHDHVDLIFAGHTHGGQIRLPWFGGTRSLTTNSDLPNWRSRGLTRQPNESWLHVSAGMGHNPWTPIRLFSPKEATLISLQATT